MAYKQGTPFKHCWATVMHSKPWNKMRNRTAAVSGRGKGNDPSLAAAKEKRKSPLTCWDGYERVPGTEKGAKGSCRKKGSALNKKKQKGGGTTKTCLPASKIRNMSKEERQKLVNSKKSAGAKGKYKRSSKTNVKGARKKGATLRDWFEKEDWRRVDDPSKKCGE